MASTPTAYPQVPAPKNPAPHFVEPTQPRPPTVPYRRTNLPPQIKQPHKQSKAAPSICVAILTMVMICATALLGRPSLHTEGAFSWFPADGYHSRLAQSANSDIWTLEWTRPSLYGLGYSAFVALRPWYENAETSWITDQYARLHTMQTGSDGIANRLVDTLWRLDTAGAKAEVEMSIVAVSGVPTLSTVIMTPGRLDIPSDITSGLNWTSEGNARIWDATAEVFTESRYLANLRAQTPGDESAASRGCLDITREQLTGEVFDIVLQTWCPGVGIVRSSEATGDWALTTSVPPTKVDSETPFDWNLVERFEFSPRLGAEPSVPGSFSVLPISAPGLVPGGIIIADRFNTEIYGLTIDTEIPQTAWTTRPGGSLTAAATLGGITLVATTNRQIVAYNKEGRWLWQTQLNDLTVAPPVRFGELAILTSLDGSVTALELRSGDIAWNLDIGAEIRSQAVVTTDRILVSNQAGALACIDAKGELLWLQDVGALQSLAVSGGDDPIVVVGKQGSVVLDAYLLETGEQLWRQRAYQNPRELISLTDVLVLRDDDWVLGIDWTTGAVLWGWNQQRTTNGIGAGERVLLLGKNGIVLLSAQGEQLRTWPLTPGEGFSGTTYLVAAGEAVLAYNASGFVIGEPR